MLKVYAKDVNCAPSKAHRTDAGYDLKASGTYTVYGGLTTKIPVGIHVEIPEGFMGLIAPRSGLATKHGVVLANTVGIIDSDYRGEVICAMTMNIPGYYTIDKYQRIAQLILVPIATMGIHHASSLEQLSTTKRGEGGFGSTG